MAELTVTIGDAPEAVEVRGRASLDTLAPADNDGAELRADYEALRIAHALACERPLDVDALAHRLVEAVAHVVPVDRAALLLRDPRTGELAVCRAWAARDGTVVLSRWVFDAAARERCAVLTGDALVAPLIDDYGDAGALYAGASAHSLAGPELLRFAWFARRTGKLLADCRRWRALVDRSGERVRLAAQFSPDLVESFVHGRRPLEPGGAMREVTALLVDLRSSPYVARHGFFAEPGEMVAQLNAHFEGMVDLVFRHGGALGAYIGDSLLALFGGVAELDDAPSRAIRCALDMREAVAVFARSPQAGNMRSAEVAIGIASGRALVGAIGSVNTRQYTAIGKPLNRAGALCRVARFGEILVDDATRSRAWAGIRVERRELVRDGRRLHAFVVEPCPPGVTV